MSFALHPRLAQDSFAVASLRLCEVRLQNNRLFPWLVLVPQRDGVSEIIDLAESDRALLMQEISHASQVLKTLHRPDKLNVAALGNVVPQLHVHVIARFKHDQAWDKPVWGQGAEPYAQAQRDSVIAALRETFESLK